MQRSIPGEQIEQIKNSIIEFGFADPLAVWGDNNIIVEGNGRYIALNELGYKEAECIRLDHLTEAERKAYTLAHNKITMNTGFDEDLLTIELEELREQFDMGNFGFFDETETGDNEEPEEIKPDVEFTEVLEEENNYIVLFFDNAIDWLQAETLFDIKTVKGLSTRKDGKGEPNKGIGRVLNGREALSKIVDWGVKS